MGLRIWDGLSTGYPVIVPPPPIYNVNVGSIDLDQLIDQRVAAFLVPAGGLSMTYDNTAELLTIRQTTYVHDQLVPASMWVINHPLNRFPDVTVIDSAGTQVTGDVRYLSNSQVQITFSAAFSGQAFLN
jgi:hypothetical protein